MSQSQPDVELGNLRMYKTLRGYPSLSEHIANDKDRTSLIYKRFDRLAARNLLYLQSELAELQAELDAFDQEDAGALTGDITLTKGHASNWEVFKANSANDSPEYEGIRKRMHLVIRLRETMKTYREALWFESELASLPSPPKKTLAAMRYELDRGPNFVDGPRYTFGGLSRHVYSDANDLVSLKTAENEDRLTNFAQSYLPLLFKTGPLNGPNMHISDRRVAIFVTWISTTLAAVLLIGAIVSLYVIRSPKWRLGMIAAFTALFASSVGLLTNARRAEVFGSTAAYAAVLVVFVSGNLGSSATSHG